MMGSDEARTRRVRSSRKLEILALFAEKVARQGYDETSIGEIANELGISKGTIVHHFGSKDRILERMSSEYMDRRLAEIDEIVEQNQPAGEQLKGLIRRTLLAHVEDRAATVAFSREFTRFMTEPLMAQVRRKRSEFVERLKEMIRRGTRDGEFRNLDPSLVGLQIMGMCNWAWTWLDPAGRLSVESVAEAFADVIVQGLRQNPKATVVDRPAERSDDLAEGQSNRWFKEAELAEMSRPTMDRAIEAIENGDLAAAVSLCNSMRSEWRFLHDLMAESTLGLISFVQERLGDDAVADAWRYGMERGWKQDTSVIIKRDRKQVLESLATTWRAHSVSGKGPHPASFTIEEDDKKFTFTMNPCGSGQRLWRMGKYRSDNAYGVTKQAHDWSYGRSGFPLYCTHCSFMNELLPIKWYGAPLYPSDAPTDFDRDPCVWYWYKDPADIPERHWSRYNLDKPTSPL